MNKARSAAVAVAVGSMIVAGGTPALAAAGDPLVVSATGLTDGQVVGPATRFHPVWTEGVEVAKISVYVNGTLNYTASSWVNGLGVVLTQNEDGTDLLVTVRAYDATGAWAEASTTVVADETLPTAAFSPAAGTLEGGTFTVTASDVSDDVAEIALVTPAGVKVATATAAPWSITYDSTGGPAGVHIEVTDRAGNVRSYTGYNLDVRAPGISGPVYYNDSPGRVRGPSLIGVTFSDQGGVSHVEWLVDGKSVKVEDLSAGYFGGSGLSYDFGTIGRTATVEVIARDRFGNQSSSSFGVVVDATGPSITSFTPAAGALVRGATISSAVKATDPAGVDADIATLNGSQSAVTGSLTGKVAAGADGKKTLTWKVYDNLGNVTTTSRSVTVDNTRPSLKITKAPATKAKVKGTVKVTASASDHNGVNRVELLINGKVVAKDVTAGYSFSINTAKYGKTIKFQLRAYDKAGNATTTATRTWHR